MKLTTVITFLAANFMVANAASTMNRIVIDLSKNDDSPSSHNDGTFPDGSGLFDTDNSVDSYDVDGFSDKHPSFFDTLADDPECFKYSTGRGGGLFPLFLFENKCVLVSSRPNHQVGFVNYIFNCCGPSSWLRFNTADWDKLLSQGNLDGVRVQFSYFKDGVRYFPLAKVTNDKITRIEDREFFS